MEKSAKIKKIIIAVTAVVLAAAIAIGVIFAVKHGKNDGDGQQTTGTEQATGTEQPKASDKKEGWDVENDYSDDENSDDDEECVIYRSQKWKEGVTEFENGAYYAPNALHLNDSGYDIIWGDDGKTVTIESVMCNDERRANDESQDFYTLKLNDYGEIISAERVFYCEDENGKEERITEDMSHIALKYNENHQLVSYVETEEEGGRRETVYEYDENGTLVKSTYNYIGEDETYGPSYTEFVFNDKGYIESMENKDFYMEINEGTEGDGRDYGKKTYFNYAYNSFGLPKFKSEMLDWAGDVCEGDSVTFEYNKVSKAQHDFYYNMLWLQAEEYNFSFL